MPLSTNWELAQQRYTRTCRTFAKNSVRQLPGFSEEDIVQELLVVLWECTMKYDFNKGASFNTLFQGCAKNRIISLIRRAETKKRKAIISSLDEEAVAAAVDALYALDSTEERCLRRMDLHAAIEEHGVEALSGPSKRRTA